MKIIKTAFLVLLILSLNTGCRDLYDSDKETGSIIFFDGPAGELMRVNSDTTGMSAVTDTAGTLNANARFSLYNTYGSSARYYVYSPGLDIIMVMLDGSGISTIDTAAVLINNIAVSPDQKYIAYATQMAAIDYYVLPVNSPYSPVSINTSGPGGIPADIDWSPDSRFVVFSSDYEVVNEFEIYTSNRDGSSITKLTNTGLLSTPQSPRWSPKGDRILFVDNESVIYQVYSIKTDGSDRIQHTNQSADVLHAIWSPDGETIAYTFNSAVYTVPSDGTSESALIFDAFQALSLVWSNYGKWLLVTVLNGTGTDIYMVDPESRDYYLLAGGFNEEQSRPVWIVD